jgi:hypothetical protein
MADESSIDYARAPSYIAKQAAILRFFYEMARSGDVGTHVALESTTPESACHFWRIEPLADWRKMGHNQLPRQ